MEVGFATHLFARFGFKIQLGIMHVLPEEKVHAAIVCVVRIERDSETFQCCQPSDFWNFQFSELE